MIFSLLFDEELANKNYAKQRTWILKRLERAGQIAGSPVDWLAFLKALSPTERQIWQELLLSHPTIQMKSVKEIEGLDDPELVQNSKDCPIVVALGSNQMERFEFSAEGELPTRREHIELIEISDLPMSEYCRINNRTFPAGTFREQVSQELLIPLIRRSTSLIFVDRYILDSFEGGEIGSSSSSLYWIIEAIGSVRAEVEYAVTLYSSYAESDFLHDELDGLARNVFEGFSSVFPNLRLRLFAAPRSSFNRVVHDRYWRLLYNGETRQMVKFSNSVNAFQHSAGTGFTYDITVNEIDPDPDQSWSNFVEYFRDRESRIENLASIGGVIYDSKKSG